MKYFLKRLTLVMLDLMTYSLVSIVWFIAFLIACWMLNFESEGIYSFGPEVTELIYASSAVAFIISAIVIYQKRQNREIDAQDKFEKSLK